MSYRPYLLPFAAVLPPVRMGRGRPAVKRPDGPAEGRCRYGHPYTPANTYRNPKGCKVCRTCRQLKSVVATATR